MDWNEIFTNFALAMIPILGTLLSGLVAVAIKWVNGKANNENVTKYTGILQTLVQQMVGQKQADIVDAIKEKSADGKLTAEEIVEITSETKSDIIRQLPDNANVVLEEIYGDLDELIVAMIKTQVQNNK